MFQWDNCGSFGSWGGLGILQKERKETEITHPKYFRKFFMSVDLRHTILSMHLRIFHYVSGTAAEVGIQNYRKKKTMVKVYG